LSFWRSRIGCRVAPTVNRIDSTENPQPLPAGHLFLQSTGHGHFRLPVNRQWIEQIIARCRDLSIAPIPLEIGRRNSNRDGLWDRSRSVRPGIEAYADTQATAEECRSRVAVAVTAQSNWEELGIAGRARVLRQVAAELARQRGETIGAMLVDAGKTVTEADVEVF
jgi:RHH-type proline utilization regulon transcriptional repressor/proline dehydrogenase/delta 1-pyrroline-5-carboxylate dehydrogenase